MPVFFIRDGMKFPDMVHALKPNPRNHIQGAFTLLPVPTILPAQLPHPAQLPQNVSVLRYQPIMSMTMQQCLCSCKLTPSGAVQNGGAFGTSSATCPSPATYYPS